MVRIRIMLVGDHELIRYGLQRLLEQEEDMEVVGDYANAEEAFSELRALSPDIVLMGTHLPGMSGVEATWHLKRNGLNYDGEVILLAESEDHRAKALEAGVACLLLKDIKCVDLARAVREVYQSKHSRESNADLVEEVIELVLPPPANAADLLRFMCQLRQPLEENYASIVRTVGSWDWGTVITIAIRPHRLSHFLAKLVNLPELEKVEKQPLIRSVLSSFPIRFDSLPRLSTSPSQRIRITLKDRASQKIAVSK